MKAITDDERDLILDLSNEGVTSLPPGVLEKDLLVTEALSAITRHAYGPVKPIFCGGTCLSKAHRLIERMSEDIDFKLVVPEDLTRSGRGKLLKAYKQQL